MSETRDQTEEKALPQAEAVEGGADAAEETAKEGGMSLLDHLGELRKRLTKCVYAVAVGFFACYSFAEDIFNVMLAPMAGILTDGHFQYTSPPEAFFTYLKVALVAGIFLVSPYIFYQIWAFVSPGLYEHERKWIIPITIVTAVLFVSGALFGYFVVFPFGFEFFASFANEKIQFIPKLNEYTTFCLQLLLAFGVVFEMPLFMLILARLGVVTAEKLKKSRKYAILIIFIVAAILTPPDPFTQTLMAGPLVLLYEISIWLAKVFGRKPQPKDEDDEEDETPAAVPAAAPTPAVEAAPEAPVASEEGGEAAGTDETASAADTEKGKDDGGNAGA
ncbi:twin-arginine translocase subunit TatC [Desulfovibrio aminophilus]|nr:twin-arginine translocase subunit TatC [Desulfovibrio aminophilus]MCM0756730.1 twin-arginine translocase subunit TatC [Desulfovibrio aminophilus]